MNIVRNALRATPLAIILLVGVVRIAVAGELDSWNDGPTKQAILEYLKKTTDPGSASFIPKEDRIAVFDNDGTLWSEKPLAVQLQFTLDRLHQLAPKHPEWKTRQPFKAALEGDRKYLSQLKEPEALQLLTVTHTGMSQTEFMKLISDWFRDAKDPRTGRLYTHRTYQPMTDLLVHLRSKDFKTYIVTGGGREFVRGFAEPAYGVPPEQVIGSSIQMKYRVQGDRPVLIREAKIAQPVNINEGKALNIEREIGLVPVIAVGNSDVDLQMLEYASSSPHPSLKILVKHDDAVREVAYTEGAEKILAEAQKQHWNIASMKSDFKSIYRLDNAKQLGGRAGR